jgi:stage III sporulation protein AG
MMKKICDCLRTKDKMAIAYLIMLGLAGVLLLVISTGLFTPKDDKAAAEPPFPGEVEVQEAFAEDKSADGDAFRREQEKRLEEAFSLIADVGQVRVVISLAPEEATVYATDENTSQTVTQETDAQGGKRETHSQTRQQETIIITDSAGQDRPLVLREIEATAQGVVIIAEGGDNVFVKDSLTKAACTLLNVEANKVQVLKMKTN